MRFVVAALAAYAATVVGMFYMLSIAPPSSLPVLQAIAVSAIGGGFIKLVALLLTRQDVQETKQVKQLVNGGLEARIASAVAAALAERERERLAEASAAAGKLMQTAAKAADGLVDRAAAVAAQKEQSP